MIGFPLTTRGYLHTFEKVIDALKETSDDEALLLLLLLFLSFELRINSESCSISQLPLFSFFKMVKKI